MNILMLCDMLFYADEFHYLHFHGNFGSKVGNWNQDRTLSALNNLYSQEVSRSDTIVVKSTPPDVSSRSLNFPSASPSSSPSSRPTSAPNIFLG